MKLTLEKNGGLKLHFHPEDDLDRVFMREIAQRAERGITVKFKPVVSAASEGQEPEVTHYTMEVPQ